MLRSQEKAFIRGIIGGTCKVSELLSSNEKTIQCEESNVVANQPVMIKELSSSLFQTANANTLESNSNNMPTQLGVLPEYEVVNAA